MADAADPTARWRCCGAVLAAGRSNQRIAHELVVALDTVARSDVTTRTSLGKLRATNRTEAVARARQLGN